jgi:hypothetical protein
VRLILDRAAQDRVEVLGFETDDAGHSAWAMVLRSTDLDWLRARLREASYQSHCQDGADRRLIVAEVVNSPGEAVAELDGVEVIELCNRAELAGEDPCLVEGEDSSF